MKQNKITERLCFFGLLIFLSSCGNDIAEVIQNDGKAWYDQNFVWLLVVGLLPIAFIRPMVNLKLWNAIYKKKYVLGATTFRKGETNAQFYAMLIFWWLKDAEDTPEVKRRKKATNIVCLISVVMAGVFVALTLMFKD